MIWLHAVWAWQDAVCSPLVRLDGREWHLFVAWPARPVLSDVVLMKLGMYVSPHNMLLLTPAFAVFQYSDFLANHDETQALDMRNNSACQRMQAI